MQTTINTYEQLVLTRDQCRAMDGYAIKQLGIDGAVLMENAGRNCTNVIEGYIRRRHNSRDARGKVAVICGRGNNGGDGFVVARHLALRGHDVTLDLLADPKTLTHDAGLNHAIADRMGVPIRRLSTRRDYSSAARRWKSCDVVVDAILGTGFAGTVREPLAEIIQRINDLEGPTIVSADIPSGLDADTGEPGGPAVRADCTVTFLAAKVGCTRRQAKPYVGKLIVADIGAPASFILKKLGMTRCL